MTRHWAAALLASAVVLASAPASHAATLDRSDAAKKALAALGAREGDDALVVFGLRETLEKGTRITQAGPTAAPRRARGSRVSARLARAGVTAIAAGRVMTTTEASWLFYADEGPSLAFEHPGRVALVGASSGKVTLSRHLRWVPLVDGRLPEFFSSPENYASKDYRVFDRPWKLRARAAKARARAAANTPETAAAQQRLADALAAERSCALRVSDTLGDFYDFGRVDKTRASLGRFLKNLSQLNAGFASQRYMPGSGRTPTQAAQRLIDAGCRDLFLYAAGSGRRTGQAGIVVGLRPRGTREIQWHTLTAAAIERLIRANRGVTFKLAFDAPSSGRIAQRLSDEPNVRVLLTSGGPDDPSFTYLPEIVGGSGVVRNPSNPFGLLEFTNGIIGGLERFVALPAEIDHAIAEQAAGRSESVMAWMLARSLDLGPSPFSAMLLGRANQRVPFTSASRVPVPVGSGGPANRAPNPTTPTTFTTAEDTARSITLTGTDPDGDPLTFAVTAQPSDGTFSGVAPNLTYTPDQDFNGDDEFTYTVSDNRGGSASETVRIRVTPDNDRAAVIGGPGLTPTAYTEQDPAVTVDNGLTVTDIDSAGLVSATAEVQSGFADGDDLDADVSGTPGISKSYDSVTGVLTLTGTASLADYQAALRTVSFESSSDDPGPSRTIRFRGFDGDEIGVPADRDIAVTEVNDAPANTVAGAKSTNEDTTLTLSGADSLSIQDADARDDDVQVTLTGTNGAITIDSTTGLSFTTGDGTDDATMTFTGSQSEINDAIDVVQFKPDANHNGSGGQVQIVTDDQGNNGSGGALSDTDAVAITVNAVNDAPVNTVPGSQSLDEDSDKTLSGALSISDVDAGVDVMQVDLSVLNGTLDVAAGGTLTGDTTDTVRIEGTATQINASLNSVKYTPDAHFAGTDTLTMLTSDLGHNPGPTAQTDTDTVGFTIDALNDPPVITRPAGTQTIDEDDPLTFTDAAPTELSVADVDSGSDDLVVTAAVGDGNLSVGLATMPGLQVVGDDTASLTLTGTLTEINDALDGLVYTPAQNHSGADTLTVTADDGGHNGAATPAGQTDSETIDIARTAVNDAPVVTTTAGTVTFAEGGPAVQVDGALTLTDVDDTTLVSATARISSGTFRAGDDLGFTAPPGITGTYDSGTGVLTFTPTGPATSAPRTDFETALLSVTFQTPSDDPGTGRTIEFLADDGDGASNTASRGVTVDASNDAPAVDASAGTASYTENDATGVIADPAVTVTDPDDANLESATVQITTNRDPATDVLAFTDQNNITGVFTASTGTLQLTGASSKANYEAALQSIRFEATGDDPSGATRTVSFKVHDGDAASAADTREVTVTPVNDAPTVDTSAGDAAFTELGAAVAVDLGIVVADVDDANLESATISVTSGHQTTDSLALPTTPSGITPSYDSTNGVLTLTGTKTVAEYEAMLRTVEFDATSSSPGASRTVTFRVNDGDANSPATNHTRGITITNNNDAPVISDLDGTVAYAENDPAVQLDGDAAVSDGDSAGLTGGTVSITGNFQPGDELSFTQHGNVDGSYSTSTGVLTITGTDTLAQYQAFLRDVTFATTDDTPDTGDRTVAFQVDDGEPSNNLSNVATKTVTVSATNDAPVVTTTGGASSYTEDADPTVVDGGGTVDDPDDTELDSASVSIANVQSGDQLHFTDTSEIAGTFVGGTMTLQPKPAQTPDVSDFEAALQSVSFSNTSQSPSTTARTINFSVNDGLASSNTASKTMNVVAVNDSPALTANDAGALAYKEDDPSENHTAAIVPNLGVSDGDDTNLTGATVQFTAGFAGAQDELFFVNQNGITGTYDTGTGVLTLSGTSSAANYETALRSVAYRNDSDHPDEIQRTVSFQVSDGHAGQNPLSNAVSRNITVEPTNDKPTPDPDIFQNGNEAVGNTSLVVDDPTDGAPNPTGPQKTVTGDILANDDDPDSASGDLTVTPETDKVTTDGGRFTVEEDGDFTYNPPAGCDTGPTDTVQYQVEDNHPTDEQTEVATLTIHVNQCVWYVDDSSTAPGGGDGRSHTPYSSLTALNGASDQDVAGERIFLYDGTYIGGLALENTQPLHTEKHGLTVLDGTGNNLQLEAPDSGATTTLEGGLALANGNSVQGLNLGTTGSNTVFALSGTNVGVSGVNNITSGTLNNPAGGAVNISGGTLDMSFSSLSSNNSSTDAVRLDNASGTFTASAGTLQGAGTQTVDISGGNTTFTYGGSVSDDTGQLVSVTNQTGGTKTFNGAVNDNPTAGDGGGIAISGNNASTTVDFNGDVDVSTGAATALAITGPGTVSLDNSASSLATNGGTVVDISGAASQNIPIDATITTATGRLVSVDGRSAGLVEFKKAISDSGTSSGIRVANNTGGDILFSGTQKEIDSGANHGVDVSFNTNATVRFENGGLDVSSTSGRAFNVSGGGTVEVSGTSNILSSGTGGALQVLNTTISGDDLTFQSVSANGATNGINLSNTGTSGGLNVTGNSTAAETTTNVDGAGSGGHIQNTTSHAVSLNNTQDVVLDNLNVTSSGDAGVFGNDLTNLSYTDGTLHNVGANLDVSDPEAAFDFDATGANNIDGAVTIKRNTVTNPYGGGIDIQNYTGTISNADLSSNTITSTGSTATSKEDGITLNPRGTVSAAATVTNADITGNSITGFPSGAGIDLLSGNSEGPAVPQATMGIPDTSNDITVSGNDVDGHSAATRLNGQFIIASGEGRGRANFKILGNGTSGDPMTFATGVGIGVGAEGQAVVQATVDNNVLSDNVLGSPGINVAADDDLVAGNITLDGGSMSAVVTNNTTSLTDGPGIRALNSDSTMTMNLRVAGNHVNQPKVDSGADITGISVENGSSTSGAAPTMCTAITGNTSTARPGSGFTPSGITVRARKPLQLRGYNGPNPGSNTDAENFLNPLNPNSSVGDANWHNSKVAVFRTGGNWVAPCTLPAWMG